MSEKSQLWALMLRINGALHYSGFKRSKSGGKRARGRVKERLRERKMRLLIVFQNVASHESDVLNDGLGVSTVEDV